MSDESPEKVETQPEKSAPKKKAAKKRSKTPEAKVIGNEASEPKAPVDAAPRNTEESSTPEPTAPVAKEESRPAREEGETPTENPSIRRISSKRQSPSEAPSGDENFEQTATIGEPPASSDPQGSKKRRRRRRKGHGSEGDEPSGNDGGNSGRSDENRPQQRPASRVELDPEKIEKKAWKIFLSEVSEEGLALVSDQDAKEIGRRSFRLAEIFLEEASKRQ